MTAWLTCPFCRPGGTFATATDVARVPCNVRRYRDSVFTMWRCVQCGSIHCAEDADLEHFYAAYPIKEQELKFHERVGYGNRLRMLTRLAVRRSDRILDFGCGPGLYVHFLQQHGFTAARGYDRFQPAYSNPDVLAAPFDVAVSYDVIEHDDDPGEFLGRLASCVRPGGLVIVGTPNADHISLGRVRSPNLHAPYHRHILSESALLTLAAQHSLHLRLLSRRSFFDSPIPTVNSRFMWEYVERCGFLDAAFEPPRTSVVLRSPALMFAAFFGSAFPARDCMVAAFTKPC